MRHKVEDRALPVNQTVSRLLTNFLQGLLGDRPTDHATRSFTIGGIYLRSTAM